MYVPREVSDREWWQWLQGLTKHGGLREGTAGGGKLDECGSNEDWLVSTITQHYEAFLRGRSQGETIKTFKHMSNENIC